MSVQCLMHAYNYIIYSYIHALHNIMFSPVHLPLESGYSGISVPHWSSDNSATSSLIISCGRIAWRILWVDGNQFIWLRGWCFIIVCWEPVNVLAISLI